MDGLVGAASIDEIKGISSEVWLSFSSLAIINMPATTVNQLPVSILKLTTTTQLAAFYTSPYYSSYSTSIKTGLTQLSTGQTVTTAGSSPGSSNSNAINFNTAGLVSTLLMALISFNQF